MKLNFKGMSGVVATALLLVVSVVAVISFQSFYTNYQSGTFVKAEQKSGSGATGVETMIGNDLYFKNTQAEDLEIKSVKIDGTECTLPANTNASANSIEKLDVSSCIGSISSAKAEVVVVTDNAVYTKFIYYKDASGSGGATLTAGNLTGVFQAGNTHSNASFANIYEYYTVTASHAATGDSNTGTRGLFVASEDYTIGNACSGNYARLFYLGNYTNSHIYIDNSTAYQPGGYTYNWTQVCISSTGGTIDLQYSNSDLSGSDYLCLGSYLQNDTYGGVIAECGSYSDRIWVKIN